MSKTSDTPVRGPVDQGPMTPTPRFRLFLSSFLMLFAELALIRWTAAYQVHVAYFTNFVLLASFLGIGVGFLRAGRARDRSAAAPLALALVAGSIFAIRVVKGFGTDGSLVTSYGMPAPPAWIMLPLIFLGAVVVMALIAEGVARLFDRFSPLEAYRLDILGSLAGIVAFSALSFAGLGPLLWGLVLAALFALIRPPARVAALVPIAAVAAVFALGSLSPTDTWSPYYRVSVYATDPGGRTPIRVNSLPHQSMLPVEAIRDAFYADPYTHLGDPPGDVLVVGAGSGNDVALALAEGARHVDAVEIDPVLQATGRDEHPAHPYQDPRVAVYVDDGRAFLERTSRRFDLILFALPDSLTLVSGQGSLRLESYLFTEEAMATVREHLGPGGAFAMYNYYKPFVFERYASTMRQVFGHEPCFDAGQPGHGVRRQAVLTIGRSPDDVSCETRWTAGRDVPDPATDDHPFPYIHGRSVPAFYLVALGLILLAAVAVVRRFGGASREMAPYADLFFMGAAFLLLETKSVVQFALLFGTTWFVNALVFAGILLAVLAAVEVARRFRLPRPWILYGLLGLLLVVAGAIPADRLLALAPIPRFVVAVAIAFAPVFVANLIFSRRFRDVGSSTVAFGANLLGAMVGGVLEYGSIVIGYRALLVLVAGLYGLAFVTGRRHLRAARKGARADALAAAP